MKTPLKAPVALRDDRTAVGDDKRHELARHAAQAGRQGAALRELGRRNGEHRAPQNIGPDQEGGERQAAEHGQHDRDDDDAADELEPFVEQEQVDGDADVAQRRPGKIKRDIEQEQRQLERAEKRRGRQRQRHEKANECRGDRRAGRRIK